MNKKYGESYGVWFLKVSPDAHARLKPQGTDKRYFAGIYSRGV